MLRIKSGRSVERETHALLNPLDAQQLDQLVLVAGEAHLEALKVGNHRLDDALVVVFVAVNVVGRAEYLSVDSAVAVHYLEQLVQELDPLFFFGEVDGVAAFLIKQFCFNDHRDDARYDELK